MTITVFLADDHGVIRDGLQLLLETQPDIKVVGQAANGREALSSVVQLCPEVVIMDIAMPELNGIEAMQQIHDHCPAILFIMLSMYVSGERVYHALGAGARGYILKESAGSEMIHAVRMVAAGGFYLSPKIADLVADYTRRAQNTEAKSPLEYLSPREREILQFVAEGKTSAAIAQMLSLSPKTIETYRSRLMEKLDIHDLPGLIRFAIRHGLIALE
jgi:DNA-binding NarL/FixJ family response regulator